MLDVPPIPRGIWLRLLAFLRAGKTGQIVFEVHHGTVQRAGFNESVGKDAADPDCPTPATMVNSA